MLFRTGNTESLVFTSHRYSLVVVSHLQHIQQILLQDIRKFNPMGRINDGVHLGNLIGDALEWGFPISHAVQNTSKGPHVTFGTDLEKKCLNQFAIRNNCLYCLYELIDCSYLWVCFSCLGWRVSDCFGGHIVQCSNLCLTNNRVLHEYSPFHLECRSDTA